jgi:hypothetical protein
MKCYGCRCDCVSLRPYDGMYPGCERCSKCGNVYDGDGDWMEG